MSGPNTWSPFISGSKLGFGLPTVSRTMQLFYLFMLSFAEGGCFSHVRGCMSDGARAEHDVRRDAAERQCDEAVCRGPRFEVPCGSCGAPNSICRRISDPFLRLVNRAVKLVSNLDALPCCPGPLVHLERSPFNQCSVLGIQCVPLLILVLLMRHTITNDA